MKLDKNAYKNCEWKHYRVKMEYTWTVTATSKSSALGMIEDEIEHPKYVNDNDYIYPDKIDIIGVATEENNPRIIYEKGEII